MKPQIGDSAFCGICRMTFPVAEKPEDAEAGVCPVSRCGRAFWTIEDGDHVKCGMTPEQLERHLKAKAERRKLRMA